MNVRTFQTFNVGSDKMKERIITILLFLIIIASSFYFGFHRLESFSGVDEPLWAYGRVPQFWNAIHDMRWKSTTLCDKPGVTLAAISGIGLPWVNGDPENLAQLRYAPKTSQELQTLTNLYFDLRLPIFLFALGMLFAFYLLIKRLLGKNIARASVVFMGLSPILLGISLMINADAILWSLLPMALLSFLIYQKEDNRKFLYLCGFILGLALIDKYVANVLFPFFFGLILLKYILDDENHKAENYFKKAFADFGLLLLVCAATIFVFFPAAWVKLKTLLDVTIFSKAFSSTWKPFFALALLSAADAYFLKGKVLGALCGWVRARRRWLFGFIFTAALALVAFVLVNTYSGMKIFDFQPVFAFQSTDLALINAHFGGELVIILSSFYPLIFSLIPVVAILFIFALVRSAGKAGMKTNESRQVFYLLVFILFYYVGSAIEGVSPTVRYQIVVYPFASIIAAIGLRQLLGLGRLKRYFSSAYSFPAILLLLVAAPAFSLKPIKPFYLSYASDLLPKQYVLDLRDMGDGSWEAAQYLNSLPDAKNIKVWSDKGGVCEAFVGTCSDSLKQSHLNTNFDYFVITAGREAKSLFMISKRQVALNGSLKIDQLYLQNNPYDFSINIDDRSGNFVQVIKADKIISSPAM